MSGYFNIGFDESLTSNINAGASAQEVRNALEGLTGVETVQVEKSDDYEWKVKILRGQIKPVTAPMHHLLPFNAAIEISAENCDKCLIVDNLSPGTQYYIRARVKNSRGWGEYSDIITAHPRAIPSAPTNVRVNVISGECLEVEFGPPVYGQPLTSYVVQWDYNEHFTNVGDGTTASCTSLRYGNCAISSSGVSIKEICGLLPSEQYYVKREVGCTE